MSSSATDGKPILRIRDLVVDYPIEGSRQRRPVVEQFSLEVRRGERTGLVGESGSGKSVAALACLGLVREPGQIRSGTITVAGVEPLSATPQQLGDLRGGAVGFIFQEPTSALNPVYTVGFQIAETVRHHRRCGWDAARTEARRLLERAAVADANETLRAYPHQLSGGQLQRVMVALALSGTPRLVIADEPTTALDVVTQARVLDLLGRLAADDGVALLLISHDLSVIASVVDRVVVMYAGRAVEAGPTAELFEKPLHPYTRLLMTSAPGRPLERTRRHAATVPELPSVGCRFAPRCPLAADECRHAEPEMQIVQRDRWTRCPVTLKSGGDPGDG